MNNLVWLIPGLWCPVCSPLLAPLCVLLCSIQVFQLTYILCSAGLAGLFQVSQPQNKQKIVCLFGSILVLVYLSVLFHSTTFLLFFVLCAQCVAFDSYLSVCVTLCGSCVVGFFYSYFFYYVSTTVFCCLCMGFLVIVNVLLYVVFFSSCFWISCVFVVIVFVCLCVIDTWTVVSCMFTTCSTIVCFFPQSPGVPNDIVPVCSWLGRDLSGSSASRYT